MSKKKDAGGTYEVKRIRQPGKGGGAVGPGEPSKEWANYPEEIRKQTKTTYRAPGNR